MWRRCCCNQECSTGFLYKKFASLTEAATADTVYPQDDVTWPKHDGVCYNALPYTNHDVGGSNQQHLAGRYYSAGGGPPTFGGSNFITSNDRTGKWLLVDEDGRGYWHALDPSGPWLEVWQYDPALGPVTNDDTHRLVFNSGYHSGIAPVSRSLYLSPLFADVRDDRLILTDLGEKDGADRVVDRVIYCNLTLPVATNAIFSFRFAGDRFGEWGTDPGPTANAVITSWGPIQPRLASDGGVYVLANPSGIFRVGNSWTYLLGSFFKLSPITGEIIGGYGRYVGDEDERDYGATPAPFKVSHFTGVDVDASGNVVITGAFYNGAGLVRLEPSGGADVTAGDTDPEEYVAKGYTQDWLVHDGSGDGDFGTINHAASDIPTQPRHDQNDANGTPGSAYFTFRNCFRFTPGSTFVAWSKAFGAFNADGTSLRAPDWFWRADNGEMHAATHGNLLHEPTEECESAFPGDVETNCCPGIGLPTTLNLTVDDSLFPPDLSVTVTTIYGYNDTGSGGVANSWAWLLTINGDACPGGEEVLASLACIESSPGVFQFQLTLDGPTGTNVFDPHDADSCDPFLFLESLAFDQWPTTCGGAFVGTASVTISE